MTAGAFYQAEKAQPFGKTRMPRMAVRQRRAGERSSFELMRRDVIRLHLAQRNYGSGTGSFNVLAVFKFMISSTIVDCCTARSAASRP